MRASAKSAGFAPAFAHAAGGEPPGWFQGAGVCACGRKISSGAFHVFQTTVPGPPIVFEGSGAPRGAASAGQFSATNDCHAKVTAAFCVGAKSVGTVELNTIAGAWADATIDGAPCFAYASAAAA